MRLRVQYNAPVALTFAFLSLAVLVRLQGQYSIRLSFCQLYFTFCRVCFCFALLKMDPCGIIQTKIVQEG